MRGQVSAQASPAEGCVCVPVCVTDHPLTFFSATRLSDPTEHAGGAQFYHLTRSRRSMYVWHGRVWPKRHALEQETSKCENPEQVTEDFSKAHILVSRW